MSITTGCLVPLELLLIDLESLDYFTVSLVEINSV